MDALAELFFQLFGELLFEAFITLVSKMLAIFFRNVNVDNKFRRNLKFALTYVFLIFVTVLLVISIVNSKTIFVVITLSFLLFQIILSAIEIINHHRQQSFLMVIIRTLKTISHYVFPSLLIVCGAIYLVDVGAKVMLIVFSSIALFVFLSIDIFRLVRYSRRSNNFEEEKPNRTVFLSKDIDE